MIFGINATSDISKLSQILYNNFQILLVAFMPNITTNHAISCTKSHVIRPCPASVTYRKRPNKRPLPNKRSHYAVKILLDTLL